MTKNKKLLLIILGILVLVLIVIAILVIKPRSMPELEDSGSQYVPEFMNLNDLEHLNLPSDSKIQVLDRAETGEVQVYKIIRDEDDLVIDPDKAREEWLKTDWLSGN